MKKTTNPGHDKFTIVYISSRALERAAYYVMRVLLVMYMIDKTLNFSREKALEIYGFLTMCLVFSQVLGAIFGDLIFGNKKALIIGGLIQALGCFAFCIPSEIALYIAIGLIILGGGFYTPNILSHFGKLYLKKQKLLDSAYTFFYLAINIGAFFGTLFIGYFIEINYAYGFALAGILMLLSAFIPLITKEQEFSYASFKGKKWNKNILIIIIISIMAILFWMAYYAVGSHSGFLLQQLNESLQIDSTVLSPINLSALMIIFFGILFTVLWIFFYPNSFVKLSSGFVFCALAYGLLLLVPERIAGYHIVFYVGYLFLLSLAEILVLPSVLSMLVKYANSKYLAIIFSVYLMVIKIFILLLGRKLFLNGSADLILKYSFIIMFAIGTIAGVTFFCTRKRNVA